MNHVLSLEYHDSDLVQDLFSRCVTNYPDHLAVSEQGGNWTYRELDNYSEKIARFLVNNKIKPGDFVGLCIERSANFVAAALGILKSGAAYVPIDTDYPVARKVHIVEDSQMKFLIATQDVLASLPETGLSAFAFDDLEAEIDNSDTLQPLCVEATSDLPAYVIYTSGTSGRPKGVVVQHKQLINLCCFYSRELYPVSTNDRVLFRSPTGFDASVTEFIWPLCSGASIHIADQKHQADVSCLTRLLISQQITFATFVPALLSEIANHPEFSQCKALRMLLCGGEAMPVDLPVRVFEAVSADLVNMYGPTETTVDATYFRCNPKVNYQSIPIGQPISNANVYLLNEDLNPVAQGETGEIYIAGKGVALGYFNQPEMTDASFLPDPFSPDQGRMYKTGDLGRFDSQGNLEFMGRNDQQIKVNGYRIECAEIESVLLKNENIERACVHTFTHRGSHQLIAYLIAKPGFSPSAFELRYLLGKNLPHYMIPQHFVFMDNFPLTPNEKIDYQSLPGPDQYLLDFGSQPPTTDLECKIAEFWVKVLSIDAVGQDSNFFFAGGDSISAAQVIAKIENEYKVEYSLIDFYTDSTLNKMACSIKALIEARESLNASLLSQYLDEIESMDDEAIKRSLEQAETNSEKIGH